MGSDLLNHLIPGSWISGQEIASRLGISRASVWKKVQALRARGYQIESSTKMGYRLERGQDLLDPAAILKNLETDFIGRDLLFYEEVPSTNKIALQIAASCREGTAVLAEVQTEGRGRMSRSWLSPPGGIWTSLVLKPDISAAQAYRINMAVSVGICRAISQMYGLEARIKWPNDILIDDRKLCGLLTEIKAEMDRLEYAVVGIGLNANVKAERFPALWKATSLSAELKKEISRILLVQNLFKNIERTYSIMSSPEIYSEWTSLSATIGQQVRVESQQGVFEGKAVSLSEEGCLRISLPEGIISVWAGDCIHLRALPS